MLKALVVDDMEAVRREIRRMDFWGDSSGFVIAKEARDGAEALMLLEAERFDLVLTDIRMPKLDGLELLKHIFARRLCSCVVILSDYDDFNYVRQGLVLGAFDYMKKPVEKTGLIELLKRAKAHILEREEQQQLSKQMEEKLKESVKVFETEVYSRELTELVQREEQASEIRAAVILILDRIYAALDYDSLRFTSVMQNLVSEMVGLLQQQYPWIRMYIDVENPELPKGGQVEDLKLACGSMFGEWTGILRELLCSGNGGGQKLVDEVCGYVLSHIDEGISLKSTAENLYLNKSYLSESFKEKTGVLFLEYLNRVKIARAKKRLRESDDKLYEIALQLGFRDSEYFGRLFKKYVGITPVQYRIQK